MFADIGKRGSDAKIDIRQAYRNVPIHPEDRPLLGVNWKRRSYGITY